jgi:hypothetical protein
MDTKTLRAVLVSRAAPHRIDVTLSAAENDDFPRALAKLYRVAADLIERTETTVACPPYVEQHAVRIELSDGETLEEVFQAVFAALKESGYEPQTAHR